MKNFLLDVKQLVMDLMVEHGLHSFLLILTHFLDFLYLIVFLIVFSSPFSTSPSIPSSSSCSFSIFKRSKTMIGYGNERNNFVLELTYNYGIDYLMFVFDCIV